MNDAAARYPREEDLEGETVTLRLMAPGDEGAIETLAAAMPAHDLLYLRRDITNPKVVAAWFRANKSGTIKTVLAWRGEEIIGCGALIHDPLSWSPHVGELRVLVAPSARQKGLGRVLIQECFRLALAENMQKLMAHMTVDQKGAVAIFEELGFRGEALLKDHVQDRDGQTHDIVILCCDVDGMHGRLSAYGVDSAL
ncbi:MAG: GNAT family N-acetyltransferase [Pseudomonadota bacterium]